MNKQTAIQLLGGTAKKVAKALGYKSPHPVYAWPEELPVALSDRIRGAAVRISMDKSEDKAAAQ